MEISEPRFEFCLSELDRKQIKDGIRKWGKPEELSNNFNGGRLYSHFEAWSDFVETSWEDWDISEYDHDIGCRYWIQLCIECSTPTTQAALERAVAATDAMFKAQMKPRRRSHVLQVSPFSKHPYFWETHTLHPELAA